MATTISCPCHSAATRFRALNTTKSRSGGTSARAHSGREPHRRRPRPEGKEGGREGRNPAQIPIFTPQPGTLPSSAHRSPGAGRREVPSGAAGLPFLHTLLGHQRSMASSPRPGEAKPPWRRGSETGRAQMVRLGRKHLTPPKNKIKKKKNPKPARRQKKLWLFWRARSRPCNFSQPCGASERLLRARG